VVLLFTWVVSSIPTLAVVIAASVVRGGISLTAPTKVVFPTPNPPAMMIFTGLGAGATDGPGLKGLEAIENLLHQRYVRAFGRSARSGDMNKTRVDHVADEYSGDADREIELRGYLGD
jgi:hypothetical protein